MRLLFILIIFISSSASACINTIPFSEAQKAVAMTLTTVPKTCAELKGEACLCYDGVDFETNDVTEKGFELNTVKVAAKESRLQAEADAKVALEQAKATRQLTIKQLAEKSGSLSASEIQSLLKAIAAELKK